MGYILGLDLGPTSIGWAAIELNDKKEPVKIATLRDKTENGAGFVETPAIGARIFPAGVEKLGQGKNEAPKNKNRREKRSTRRRLRRAGARRKELVDLLVKKGFISNHQAVEKLQSKDPYEIRAKAVNEKVKLEDIARIFLHFTKRRGFKSNRKQPEDKDAKASDMKLAKERLAQEINGRTIGQFWDEKIKSNPFTAIRNRKGDYKWIALREQYQDELVRIWQIQAPVYPAILTKDFYDVLSVLLFKQIPFELTNRKKKKIIGTCELIPGMPRCPWADRKAQKFRLLQKVNDLLVREGWKDRSLTPEERKKLVDALLVKKEITFDDIRKLLWGDSGQNKRFNLEYKVNDKIIGNVIDYMLNGGSFFDKKAWLKLNEQQKDLAWGVLREYLDEKIKKQSVEEKISKEYGLVFKKEDWPGKLKEPTGYCSYSKEALDKILPGLEEGKNLYQAIEDMKINKNHKQTELLRLPTKENGISIPNPVVRSMLFQLRKVVNLIVKEKGLPDEVVIETVKEIKANKERRQEISNEQKANQVDRSNAVNAIRGIMGWGNDVEVSGTDILKYRLWSQQNEYCPYSCTKISPTELFSRNTEVDHILPYSMSMDNAMDNKIVCFSNANQNKGQNTPISWMGETSERWQNIERAKERFGFSDEKWDRFCTKNEEITDKYLNRRLLQDTAYIARVVREYLQRLYPADKVAQKVRTTKGGITAELRNLWGLNAILRDGEIGPKNREDLRHHAIDAAVVALTGPGQIQKITKKLQQNWPKRPKYAEITEPWNGFGEDLAKSIQQVKVSHRVQRKVKGALHKETQYWKEENGEFKGKYITSVNLNEISIKEAQRICDKKIKGLVLARLTEFNGDNKTAFEKPLYIPFNPEKERTEKSPKTEVPIYSVRIWENIGNPISIRKEKIKPNNFTNEVWVKPDENHHIEIFKGDKEYLCKVWSMWDVVQRIKNEQPIILRKHPEDEAAQFVMSLSKGETIYMKGKSGQVCLVRIVAISGDLENPSKIDMDAKPIQIADVKLEKEDKSALRKEWRIQSLKDFGKIILQKVTIDPLGRVRRAND